MLSLSSSHFDPHLSCWRDYLPFLRHLSGAEFPACPRLNAMRPDDLRSAGGHAIRFVDSGQCGDENYEHRIYTTGQVSTRAGSWHDLFNALVWLRYPNIKTAMNRLHYEAGAGRKSGARGPVRDALTLFDECGVIVVSDCAELLQALAERRWRDAFLAQAFSTSVVISVVGHAMLEKFLAPYKAMTANALLVRVNPGLAALPGPQRCERLDQSIAKLILEGKLLTSPACLSPLPLAGIPGWWPPGAQNDERFYHDQAVFRRPPPDLKPAPIYRLHSQVDKSNNDFPG